MVETDVLSFRSSRKNEPGPLGDSPVPISAVMDGESNEVLRCVSETLMATARPERKMGSHTDVVLRSIPEKWSLLLRDAELKRAAAACT